VNKFKGVHTSNLVGSEMYDDGFPNSNSDEEDDNHYGEFNIKEEEKFDPEAEYPNIDSPRLTVDIKKDRTFKTNNKTNDLDGEELEVANEDEPEVPNEISPGMYRKHSSNISQGDYELIGDHAVRETLTMKNKPSEDNKENINHWYKKKSMNMGVKYEKTQKGYSEISQMDRKTLSVIVHKAKICKDGFFSFSYPSYGVELNPARW
jgi:hypothetical protein